MTNPARRGRSRTTVLALIAGSALAGGPLLASPALAAAAPAEPSAPPPCEADADPGPDPVNMTGIDDADHQGMVELSAGDQDPALIAPENRESGQRFGASVVGKWLVESGGHNFIFVGAPGETVGEKENAGAVYVYLNTADGICQLDHLTQDDERIPGEAEAGAEFGASVDATEGSEDVYPHWLYVGAPGLSDGEVAEAGGVAMVGIASSQNGEELGVDEGHLTTLSSAGAEPTEGARFGHSVVETGVSEWFAGAPGATVDGAEGAGLVVGQHHRAGDDPINEVISQGTEGMQGTPEADDAFGSDLTVSDQSDLAWIGVPGEDVGDVVDAGMVSSFKMDYDGESLGSPGPAYTQNTADDGTGNPVPGTAEEGDRFGAALGTVPVTERVWDDAGLLVGTPGEDALDMEDVGTVTGLHGAPSFSQADVGGEVGQGNEFGAAVDRLSVGAPGTPGDNASGATAIATYDGEDLSWTHQPAAGELDEGAVYGATVGVSEHVR